MAKYNTQEELNVELEKLMGKMKDFGLTKIHNTGYIRELERMVKEGHEAGLEVGEEYKAVLRSLHQQETAHFQLNKINEDLYYQMLGLGK